LFAARDRPTLNAPFGVIATADKPHDIARAFLGRAHKRLAYAPEQAIAALSLTDQGSDGISYRAR